MTGSSELRAFAHTLRTIDVPSVVSPVLSKAGATMRDKARAAAPTGPHLRMKGGQSYADMIIFQRPNKMRVEMGAMSTALGDLSAVLEFGQGPNAPHPHIVPQLDPEAEVTVRFLGEAVVKALRS